MRELLILFIIIISQSCRTGNLVKTDECKSYYNFIKKNWEQNDDFTYSFKGNPRYWGNDVYKTYINENCLMGLSTSDVQSIFGIPTKTYKSLGLNMYSYCLDEYCQNTQLYGGRFLQINFNKEDIVIEVFTSPGDSDVED